MSTGNDIGGVLKGLSPVTLEEMGSAGLMRRKDSKFVFAVHLLPRLMETVRDEYRVLEIGGERSQLYQTTYYDTEDLDMYHMHHRGKASRHKVRFRNYTSSDQTFLEVKRKNSRKITNKKRMPVNGEGMKISRNAASFLEHHIPYVPAELKPVLDNSFRRITLVNEEHTERITLDYELKFSSHITGGSEALPGLAIAEVKYTGHLSASPFNLALRELRVLPRRISKYCTGMAILHPDLKQNLFKRKLHYYRQINARAM